MWRSGENIGRNSWSAAASPGEPKGYHPPSRRGDVAPYGYKLVDGYLEIAEDEVEVIQIIFDKYVNTNMGAPGIAAYLNGHGYVKKKRQNNTMDVFSTSFVRRVLENPIYAGKLAYGRRKTEKIPGTRNQFHIVAQKEYPVYDGAHEGIISEEVWQQAQKKRQDTSCTWEKVYHPEREHLLSGLLRCPVCGVCVGAYRVKGVQPLYLTD